MNPSEIGADLCALVCHLYSRLSGGKKSSVTPYRELCLRTGVPYTAQDAQLEPVDLRALRDSKWYAVVRQQYDERRERMQVQHRSRFEEVEEMASMLYPKGCSLSEYAEAVHSCIGMLTFTIPQPVVNAFLQRQDELRQTSDSYAVTGEELKADMKELVQDSVFPRLWWRLDINGKEAEPTARSTRVALQCHPPQLVVEYEGSGEGRRCRRIHLPREVLSPSYPVGPIARRIGLTHGAIISELECQRLLLDLQRLAQQQAREEMPPSPRGESSGLKSSSTFLEPAVEPTESSSSMKPSSSVDVYSSTPQAADLCLLYRDPEAALVNVDLNHADDDTVKEFKEVMDIKFKENALKPGDPGYEYDKRVEVKPVAKSEWDDSDEEDEF